MRRPGRGWAAACSNEAMSYSLSKLREEGEEEEREGREENGCKKGEGRAIWQCVPLSGTVSLTFGNSNYRAERNTPVSCSLYQVPCLIVSLHCAT